MKEYVLGIDGGGSKTRLVLCDFNGNVQADVVVSGCNHQHIGKEKSHDMLKKGFCDIKQESGTQNKEIKWIYLGLSGADIQSDFDIYNEISESIFDTIPFTVVNDVWLVKRAGLTSPYGSVAICGTGANAATTNKKGKSFGLRQLEYELGAYGGSMDIAKEGFHRAFCSEEATGDKTTLESELPKILGQDTLEQCIPFFYPEKTISVEQMGEVTKLIFRLAENGDVVCIDILSQHGIRVAMNLIGTMRRANVCDEKIPIVLGGTLLSFTETPLYKSFCKTVIHHAPHAIFYPTVYPPVVGAVLSGMDKLNISQTVEIRNNLMRSL